MIPASVQADLASEKMNGKLKHYIPHIVSEWYEETKHKKNEHYLPKALLQSVPVPGLKEILT